MTLRQLAARKAVLTRHFGPEHPDTMAATAALRTALLKQAINEAVQTLPPLSTDERAELAALLLSALSVTSAQPGCTAGAGP